MPHDDHFAILVGIHRYGDMNLKGLDGPPNDIELMRKWLVNPARGGLRPEHVELVVTDPTKKQKVGPDLPPLAEDFLNKFMSLVQNDDGSWKVRKGSRLYLYFSGHGFSEKKDATAHAALYAGNCRLRGPFYNIYGTFYAKWAKSFGLFDEIVLIMDCCRDAEATKQPTKPPLPENGDVGTGKNVRMLEIYAAPRGGKAQERAIPDREGLVHGLLTHVLIEALENAGVKKGGVSGADIKSYIEQRWQAVCGSNPVNPPEIYLPQVGDIIFDRPENKATGIVQRFRVGAVEDGASFSLFNGDLSLFRTIHIHRPSAKIQNPATLDVGTADVVDDVLSIELEARLYKAQINGSDRAVFFQAGDDHVVV